MRSNKCQQKQQTRIKINKFLEETDWRLFENDEGKADIVLENNAKLTSTELDEFA